jgi:hypothetical protein
MRLCTTASLCLAAAAALVPAPGHAAPEPDPGPSCVAPEQRSFPITTRIHGGPDSYEAGGGFGAWYLELTNTTNRTCANIHPVVVLVDERRALEPDQPRLEFQEGTASGPSHPVPFERTDSDELVGVFGEEGEKDGEGQGEGDKFPGFTIGPGKTLTVKVRLAVTSDAVPNEVTANAAVVQRHDGDGDWVGQSNDYRFEIDAQGAASKPSPSPDSESAASKPSPSPDLEATARKRSPSPDPEATATATDTAPPTGRLPFADELAGTGLGPTGGALVVAAVLLLVTGGTLLLTRKRR